MSNKVIFNKKQEDEDDGGRWIYSYADMITLLFAFFVVLVAISNINMVKYEMITQYFTKTSDRLTSKDLQAKISEFIKTEKMEEQIDVKLTAKGVEISFKDKLLFDSGKAQLKPRAYDILSKISELLQFGEIAERKIAIEGHTDRLPIHTKVYPSNWELSSGRAASVVRFLTTRKLDSRRFESIGYAQTRPTVKLIKGRLSQPENRRVVMVISPDSYLIEQKKLEMSLEPIIQEEEVLIKKKPTTMLEYLREMFKGTV